MEKRIKVIFIKPHEEAEIIEIDNNIPSFRKLLRGRTKEYMPFDDDVALIVNEKERAYRDYLNRAVRDEDGKILEIIIGDFFIVHTSIYDDFYSSLEGELLDKYYEMFREPEKFYRKGDGSIDAGSER